MNSKLSFLVLLAGVAACVAALEEDLTAAEIEAYAQVDMLMSEDGRTSLNQDMLAGTEQKISLLRATLENLSMTAQGEETSLSGEVRGAAIVLMRKLIELHDLIDKSGQFRNLSEEIGSRISEVGLKLKKQLSNLELLLATFISLAEESYDRVNVIGQDSRPARGQDRAASKPSEVGWLARLLGKIFG